MQIDRRVLIAAGPCHWTAGRGARPSRLRADEDAVAKSVEAFRAAQAAANAEALAALCAAELSYSHSDGRGRGQGEPSSPAPRTENTKWSVARLQGSQDPRRRPGRDRALPLGRRGRGGRRRQEERHQPSHPDELAKAGQRTGSCCRDRPPSSDTTSGVIIPGTARKHRTRNAGTSRCANRTPEVCANAPSRNDGGWNGRSVTTRRSSHYRHWRGAGRRVRPRGHCEIPGLPSS